MPADNPNTGGHHQLGGGPAIFRGPLVNPAVFDLLVGAAEAEGIPHTIETGLEFIDQDEIVEITPDAVRIRKKVLSISQRPKRTEEST